MKAIILAAGKSSRLYPLTIDKPKGLLKVNGIPIIDRLVNQFRQNGIEEIIIVVGYMQEKYIKHFGKNIKFIFFPDFADTNNLSTLWHIRQELNDDVLISFSDLYLDSRIVKNLVLSNDMFTFAIDTSRVLSGTMPIESSGRILKSITSTNLQDANGNFIGISKISKTACIFLIEQMSKMNPESSQLYYTSAINELLIKSHIVNCIDFKKYKWTEIDTQEEYIALINSAELFT